MSNRPSPMAIRTWYILAKKQAEGMPDEIAILFTTPPTIGSRYRLLATITGVVVMGDRPITPVVAAAIPNGRYFNIPTVVLSKLNAKSVTSDTEVYDLGNTTTSGAQELLAWLLKEGAEMPGITTLFGVMEPKLDSFQSAIDEVREYCEIAEAEAKAAKQGSRSPTKDYAILAKSVRRVGLECTELVVLEQSPPAPLPPLECQYKGFVLGTYHGLLTHLDESKFNELLSSKVCFLIPTFLGMPIDELKAGNFVYSEAWTFDAMRMMIHESTLRQTLKLDFHAFTGKFEECKAPNTQEQDLSTNQPKEADMEPKNLFIISLNPKVTEDYTIIRGPFTKPDVEAWMVTTDNELHRKMTHPTHIANLYGVIEGQQLDIKPVCKVVSVDLVPLGE